MLETLVLFLVGITGGISVGVQSSIVSKMSQRVSGAAGSFVVHLSGALFSGVFLFFYGRENFRHLPSLPWYMLISGLFGLILVLTINQTIPRLGAATAFTLIVIGQIGAGMVIDHFGLFGAGVRHVDMTRLVALGLLLAGSYLTTR